MIPQPPEFFEQFATDRRHREGVAAAERLRGPGFLRARSASALRGLADHLAPVSVPPRTTSVPAVARPRPARSGCQHQHAA
jgi:hypothetical protein